MVEPLDTEWVYVRRRLLTHGVIVERLAFDSTRLATWTTTGYIDFGSTGPRTSSYITIHMDPS